MIAITGASGLVGGNLVRALLAQGSPVRALVHRERRALESLNVETASADLTDPASLRRAFEGAEVVYHLASAISINMGGWEQIEETNVTGTRNVVEACLDSGVRRMVYFSSIHAYQQEPLDQTLTEDRQLLTSRDVPPYVRSKAAAELVARQAAERGLETVIVIPTAIIGPNDFGPSLLGQALQLLAAGRIPALVQGGYDWVDVRDVVDGAIEAERSAPSGSRYILSGHWRSLRELAEVACQTSGKPAPWLTVPIWLAEWFQPVMATLAQINHAQPLYTQTMLEAMRSNRQISSARAARDLGYAPRPFEDTIGATLAWFETHKAAQ